MSKETWRTPPRRTYASLDEANRAPLIDAPKGCRNALFVLLAVILFVFVILPGYRLLSA